MRKVGALSLGPGVWAVPEVPAFADRVRRAAELTEQAEGQMMTLRASGREPDDAARLEALFTAARSEDWAEFLADCAKFEAEIAKEIRNAKFTLAELEEEEQSLERLRRWHRDLTARDVFGAPEAAQAGERLRQCASVCEDYAERVFATLHGSTGAPLHGNAAVAPHDSTGAGRTASTAGERPAASAAEEGRAVDGAGEGA
ncbi:Chromate resistance protein ChrB [Nonomuraea antimicrobica]